jgi:hypothetical protein
LSAAQNPFLLDCVGHQAVSRKRIFVARLMLSSISLMKTRNLLLLGGALAGSLLSPAYADSFEGELYYTRYGTSPNIRKVTVGYDGTSFSVGTPVTVGNTQGADGIAGDPQNSDLLLVGGQGGNINTISKSTGVATAYSSPASVFHLAVPTSTTVLGSGIPGNLARHTINPDGSLGSGTLITLSGNDQTITTVIPTPSGYYYTDANAGGNGNFGKIVFNTGIDTATSATTTLLNSGVPSAHGGLYDPFSGDIFLFGSDQISQYDPSTGTFLGTRTFAGGGTFDQGAVDGNGHLFVANNNGNLLMIDYDATGKIYDGSDPTYYQFLDDTLDDIAPLVGPGSSNVPDGGSTAVLITLGMAGFAVLRRRLHK